MKSLIILNYQGTIPPFMQTEVNIAKTIYKDIYYITREFRTDNRETVLSSNVHIVELDKKIRSYAYLKFFLYILNRDFWSQLYVFVRKNKKGGFWGYLKLLLTYEYCRAAYTKTTENIINELHSKGDEIVLLATWFSVEAYTAAKLKKKYPFLTAVSYAHAFEIDPIRSDYVAFTFNAVKHKYLNGIYFISSKKRDIYLNEVGGLNEEFLDRIHVSYLGSINREGIVNHPSNDGVFRICTCSALYEEKRIDVLIDALADWSKCNIVWQHLGGAGYVTKTRKHAEVLNNNPFVTYNITGKVKNDVILDYYKNNPVDVFLNISKSEGIPVSIMEVCSYGIPVIATNVGGTSEIVNSEIGNLIPSEITPQYIKEVLEQFYELPDEDKAKMRKASVKMWDEKFNADKSIRNFLTEIQK